MFEVHLLDQTTTGINKLVMGNSASQKNGLVLDKPILF